MRIQTHVHVDIDPGIFSVWRYTNVNIYHSILLRLYQYSSLILIDMYLWTWNFKSKVKSLTEYLKLGIFISCFVNDILREH